MAEDRDIFKESPIRYLGYANEGGEAFRAFIPKSAVLLSYGVATLYVVAHTVNRFLHVAREESTDYTYKKAALTGLDTFVWQMLASVAVPGYIINRSCYGITYLLGRTNFKHKKFVVTAFGLTLIPFIVQPIDKSIDYILDATFRPLVGISTE